jgi:hypothetical protein
MTFHINHPPRPKNHPWKRGVHRRMAAGKRMAEARAAKDRAEKIESELYDLPGLEKEARMIAEGQ